jgi:hypothetical protein
MHRQPANASQVRAGASRLLGWYKQSAPARGLPLGRLKQGAFHVPMIEPKNKNIDTLLGFIETLKNRFGTILWLDQQPDRAGPT